MTPESKCMRVNARLSRQDAEMLDYLVQTEGRSVTEIVRIAIRRYYEQAQAARGAPAEALEKTGFIGCAAGESDLSTSYKQAFGHILNVKQNHR